MKKSNASSTITKSPYFKHLKRTSIFQLVLFVLGILGALMNGEQNLSGLIRMGFGVVWTDNLVLAALFGLIFLITKLWAPKVSAWCGRTALSMIQWVPISFAGYILFFIL